MWPLLARTRTMYVSSARGTTKRFTHLVLIPGAYGARASESSPPGRRCWLLLSGLAEPTVFVPSSTPVGVLDSVSQTACT